MNIAKQVEPHVDGSGEKLNRLRAAVLGANDGIVSTAALVVGVAGASNSSGFILTAGIAGLVAGALSMGVGEFISVSAQRDSEKVLIDKETDESKNNQAFELDELTTIYKNKGLSVETAQLVAKELTSHNALAAHFDAELHIDPDKLVNPFRAAYSSALSFVCGAAVPIFMVIIAPVSLRVPVTFFGVLLALIITGFLSALAGGANKTRAIVRVVLGGMFAMIITFGIGKIFGVSGI